jgi:hypothetical protein
VHVCMYVYIYYDVSVRSVRFAIIKVYGSLREYLIYLGSQRFRFVHRVSFIASPLLRNDILLNILFLHEVRARKFGANGTRNARSHVSTESLVCLETRVNHKKGDSSRSDIATYPPAPTNNPLISFCLQ